MTILFSSRLPSLSSPTVADLLDAYELEYLPHQALNTQKRKRAQFRQIRATLGHLPLTTLTREDLVGWRNDLSQRMSAGTLKTYMDTLGAAFTVAVRDYEWLDKNPMARVKKPPIDAERIRFLDAEEQARLLAACQRSPCPFMYHLVLLALTTGARKMELLMLRWQDIDWGTGGPGAMRLERTKTRLKRGVPMPLMTVETLRPWHEQARSVYVFPGAKSQPPDISRRWYQVLRMAQVEDFRFHDLRHSAASYLAMSGVRIEDIAVLLGHKSLQTTERYRHMAPAYTASLVEAMAARFIHPH